MGSLLLWFFCLVWLPEAFAQFPVPVDCSSGDAPNPYDLTNCNANCWTTSFPDDQLVCWSIGTTDPALTIAVEDYHQNGDRTYSVWGSDGAGANFCCFNDDEALQTLDKALFITNDQDDEVSLTYIGRDMETLETSVYTYDGDDIIDGSNSASCLETLYGGQDVDTIYGDNGEDVCEGGDGGDVMEGGDARDILRGGEGNDTLSGNAGSDLLCGGPTSGAGHDSLYGVTAASNELGGNEVDKLWSPSTANTPVGNSQSGDLCGHTSHGSSWSATGCTYTLTTEPGEC